MSRHVSMRTHGWPTHMHSMVNVHMRENRSHVYIMIQWIKPTQLFKLILVQSNLFVPKSSIIVYENI